MVNCYLCKSNKSKVIHRGVRDNPNINVLKCEDCGLVFLDTFAQITKDFYQTSKMHGDNLTTIDEWLLKTTVDDRRHFDLLKDKIAGKNILDFGCGAAGFLKYCSSIANSAEGIELEKRVIKFWRGKLEIHTSIPKNKYYDIITSFHVFEHLEDPIHHLMNLKSVLTDNGCVIIEVPNADDALLTLFDCEAFKKFSYWSQHLYLFTADNLKTIAERAGFEKITVTNIQRYPLANHLFWLSQGKPEGHEKWQFAVQPKLNVEYSKLLAEIGIADTLLMYAYN